jgi:hypothetical protein
LPACSGGTENSILGCKRMCHIILFYLDHPWISIFKLYSMCITFIADEGTSEHFRVGRQQIWTTR